MPINNTVELVQNLLDQNAELRAQNAALLEQLARLNATVEALNQTIKELREQKNKNSRNSSKPPSSDGLKKGTKDKSLREPSGKKQGAQQGHSGTHMVITGEPDTTQTLIPDACKNCPNWEKCKGTACVGETRYKVDVKVIQTLDAYESMEVHCPKTNQILKGAFPSDIKGQIQYGESIASLIVTLNTVGAVSAKRTQEILGSLFDLPISTGTVLKMVSRCAAKVRSVVETIKEHMCNAAKAHFDETGTRVDGHTRWAHVASDELFTYLYFSHKRGHAGMTEMDVLPNFHGVAIHDCWASYWKFDILHAVCCAHLLRELNGVMENHPEQTWATRFKKLLLDMKKAKEDAMAMDLTSADGHKVQYYDEEYDAIIKTAFSENPMSAREDGKKGRPKKGKVLALIERLQKHKGEVCLFLKDFQIDFDNNQAERDLRMIKTKTKVSGCFRTEEGIRDYLTVMSYIGTARKHGKNAVEAIKNAFMGTPELIFE